MSAAPEACGDSFEDDGVVYACTRPKDHPLTGESYPHWMDVPVGGRIACWGGAGAIVDRQGRAAAGVAAAEGKDALAIVMRLRERQAQRGEEDLAAFDLALVLLANEQIRAVAAKKAIDACIALCRERPQSLPLAALEAVGKRLEEVQLGDNVDELVAGLQASPLGFIRQEKQRADDALAESQRHQARFVEENRRRIGAERAAKEAKEELEATRELRARNERRLREQAEHIDRLRADLDAALRIEMPSPEGIEPGTGMVEDPARLGGYERALLRKAALDGRAPIDVVISQLRPGPPLPAPRPMSRRRPPEPIPCPICTDPSVGTSLFCGPCNASFDRLNRRLLKDDDSSMMALVGWAAARARRLALERLARRRRGAP